MSEGAELDADAALRAQEIDGRHGAAGAVTTVDLLGTQGGVSVKLCAFAQASLSQSTVLVMGGAGAAVLTDGASYAICDAGTAITLGKTGSALTTATFIDILLTFVLDAA